MSELKYSNPVSLDQFDTLGFAQGFPLRKHKSEEIASLGTDALRADWRKFVGPITKFGSHNPRNGHCVALLWPLTKPERIWLISYIIEYVFLYDSVLESARAEEPSGEGMQLVLDASEGQTEAEVSGLRKIQAKMLKMLHEIDPEVSPVVEEGWKQMVRTSALRDKSQKFKSMEEYYSYRPVDAGSPLCSALICWGIGINLPVLTDKRLLHFISRAYIPIGLANDVVSFDEEYKQFCSEGKEGQEQLTNTVSIMVDLRNVDVESAKLEVSLLTRTLETELKELYNEALKTATTNEKRFMSALMHQAAGNVVWSLNCPRYHPQKRSGYDLDDYVDADLNLKG